MIFDFNFLSLLLGSKKISCMIVTHSGKFHADEAFACFMLKSLSEFAGLPIVRSRDPAVIAKGKAVVDVGAVYDSEKMLFDHHQREFAETFSESHSIKLSSAGLVYK